MEIGPKGLVRLAHLTRRFDRYRNPIAYRICRRLLHLIYPGRKRTSSRKLVLECDGCLMDLDTASSIEYALLFHGRHEPGISEVIRRTVKPGATCADLGANVGAHALLMARLAGPTGRVIAVEPHPVLAARLSANVALNRLGNVTVVRAALADRDGTATLYSHEDDDYERTMASLTPSPAASKRIEVPTLCGKTLRERYGLSSCDFMKIDVEGGELMALREMADLIASSRPHLVFEHRRKNWERSGSRIEDAISLLAGRGYSFYTIVRDVIAPLEGEVPDKCDLFCVPRSEA